MVPEEFLFNDLDPPKFTFEDSGFTVTPTSFTLNTGDEVVIDVEFKHSEVNIRIESYKSTNCDFRHFV